ncbi:MAG: paraquat-inducible protein A [Magnetococcales bacterium]|nr:paraquat-inducible protein A [Magnetococcales bacterium]
MTQTGHAATRSTDRWIACHECDLIHPVVAIDGPGKASCRRCGSPLYASIPNTIDRALALHLSAFMLLLLTNLYPFISLKLGGRIETNMMGSGVLAMAKYGMPELGILVFLTSILFPLLSTLGMISILLPMKFGWTPPTMPGVYRFVRIISSWSLLGVFMLGLLVAIVKLLDLATVIPGIGLFAFIGLIVVSTAAFSQFDPRVLWQTARYRTGEAFDDSALDDRKGALNNGLISCHDCSLLIPLDTLDSHGHGRCPRCGSSLHPRKQDSIIRTWALVVTACILLIPANTYPVMTVIRFGQGAPDTIMSGVIHLIEGGMWPLALLVFFASVVVPVTKLIVLVFLLRSVQKRSPWRPTDRTRLYRATEVVGAWSMVDIYLIAILGALVNLDAISTIEPGIGATFFASVVVVTMIAAHSFDPRLIWDNLDGAP